MIFKINTMKYKKTILDYTIIFFSVTICLLDTNPLYCMDDLHALNNLKEELSYWQDDLQGLNEAYKSRGYDVLNPDHLSKQDLADKAELEECIKDGRKNVKTSIENIKNLKEKISQSDTQCSSLGKRQNQSAQYQPNKKQG